MEARAWAIEARAEPTSEKSGRKAWRLGEGAAEAAAPPEAGDLETPAPTLEMFLDGQFQDATLEDQVDLLDDEDFNMRDSFSY